MDSSQTEIYHFYNQWVLYSTSTVEYFELSWACTTNVQSKGICGGVDDSYIEY